MEAQIELTPLPPRTRFQTKISDFFEEVEIMGRIFLNKSREMTTRDVSQLIPTYNIFGANHAQDQIIVS